MRIRFTFLSKFAVKFVEVAGAGLASAACAYVFGQIERPQPPAAPVVQVAPVSERARMARDDRPLLGETARKETDSQPESAASQPESAAATPTTVSTPKLAKLTQPAGRAARDFALQRRIQCCAQGIGAKRPSASRLRGVRGIQWRRGGWATARAAQTNPVLVLARKRQDFWRASAAANAGG